MNAVITQLNHETHRKIMLQVLIDFYRDDILQKNLVFKWGTALYVFYQLDRFSTDLDFDLIDTKIPGEEILKRVQKVLEKHWEIKELRVKRYTIFGILSYWWTDQNIKIEISTRGVSGKYESKNLFWKNIITMKIEDMFANKLFALTNRTTLANRDIYDIYFLFQNKYKINKTLLEEKVKMSQEKYFDYCIEFLEKLWGKYKILDGLWSVLTQSQKNFVKKQLIEETILSLHLNK